MSSCEGTSGGLERYPGTGCCGTSCAAGRTGCLASETRVRSCLCQENVGCLDRADCGGFHPRGTAATGACPGPCQCAEEEVWNRNIPPKPNCEWLSNFSELRRQWSDHGRQNNCKCCNCKPCRTAATCKPCFPLAPRCSKTMISPDNCQKCCYERLSGGACGQCAPTSLSPVSRKPDWSPVSAMHSSGGCPPPSCNRTPPSSCCSPNVNVDTMPCDSPSECSLSNSCSSPPPCRPPSSCQPCSPSPRPNLKKRSCCQCITGFCMCQPMPRNCNCPPPVQVDARAEHECSCSCPSSPECACPPSERRFPKTKVKCPNARMCCPTPRPQPGPKCCCTKCQPCLPPPCDPCTSSKCRTVAPKIKPCCADSPCDERAPCRPETPKITSPCRPITPCSDCRKMSLPCRSSLQNGSSYQAARQIRPLNRPRSPVFQCPPTSGPCKSDEGYGDDDGEADTGYREAQCHCGSSGSRGCDELCDYCCSLNCNNDEDDISAEPTREANDAQCDCGYSKNNRENGCDENCDYCCSLNCDDQDFSSEPTCIADYDHCCSRNCDTEPSNLLGNGETSMRSKRSDRIAAGGTNEHNYFYCQSSPSKLTIIDSQKPLTSSKETSTFPEDCFTLQSICETVETVDGPSDADSKFQINDNSILKTPQESDDSFCSSQSPIVKKFRPAVVESPRSACKLLRSLIRTKSPAKFFER